MSHILWVCISRMWNLIIQLISEKSKRFFGKLNVEKYRKKNIKPISNREGNNYEHKIKYMRIGEIVSIAILLSLVLYMMLIA